MWKTMMIRILAARGMPVLACIATLACIALPGLTAGCSSSDEKTRSYQSRKARIMNEMGLAAHEKGQTATALSNFRRALSYAESTDDRDEAVRAHINLGQVLAELDHLEEAGTHIRNAMRAADELDDDVLRFAAHRSMGKYLFLAERYDEAEDALDEALDLAEDLDSRESEALVRNDLGAVLRMAGRLDEALEHFLTALFLYENLEGRVALVGRGSVCNNLATIREDQGKYSEAWDLLTTSLSCHQQLGDQEALYTCHANMGRVLETWGKRHDALLRYERAYGVAKEIPNPRYMDISLQHILRLSRALKEQRLLEEYERIYKAFRNRYHGDKENP